MQVGQPADTPDADGIHQSLLSGLLSHIGMLEEREKGPAGERRGQREYLGARGARFAIFPGSVLHRKNPQFLMAGELVETTRLWARQNAAIKPEWAEQLGAHLVKRTYSEPHWSRKRAAVMAHERVTLYGVPLVADRLVQLRQDRPGRWPASSSSATRSCSASGTAGTGSSRPTAACSRRPRSSSTGPGAATSWSTSRRSSSSTTPASAPTSSAARTSTSGGSGRGRARPTCSPSTRRCSPTTRPTRSARRDFPTAWHRHATSPAARGSPSRSATTSSPARPTTASPSRCRSRPSTGSRPTTSPGWCPGLREELVTELIRSLPKNLRVASCRRPTRAREFLAATPPGEEPLLDALERYLRSTTGVVVPREAWDWSKVAEHLRPTYRVVDETGTSRRAARTSTRSRSRCARASSRRWPTSPPTAGCTAHRPDRVDLRPHRGVVRAAPRRPRGARPPGARRRGRDRRAAS